MASTPVEIVTVGNIPDADLAAALALANSVQHEFAYCVLPGEQAGPMRMRSFDRAQSSYFLDALEQLRHSMRGFHPFLIAVVDSHLDGPTYSNLFGSHLAEKGLAVVTVANVSDLIISSERIAAYFLYYLARYSLSFVSPAHRDHDDARGCVFDRKLDKRDLVRSMRARAVCDECRGTLLSEAQAMSAEQFHALDLLFAESGRVLEGGMAEQPRPRVFVGSSSEGLPIANKVQELLSHDAAVVVWNQGTVFGLGQATLEALEQAVESYDFGIFVFTPDDELLSRGQAKPVARDNVLFELGLFVGGLGRRRAFVVNPREGAVVLPSDLVGIATATYSLGEQDLAAALGPVSNQLRQAIRQAVEEEGANGIQRGALARRR